MCSKTFLNVKRCSSIVGSESSQPLEPKQIDTSNYVIFFKLTKMLLNFYLESKSSSIIFALQYLNTRKRN
jgi:hypothetical protein